MSFSWPSALYIDQDFTVPEAVQIPEPSSPITAQPDSWLFTQDWMQLLANWQPGPYNMLHPDFSSLNASYSGPDFFLVNEGPRRDLGGGIAKWTRTYAAKPTTHDEFETFGYNFIGFTGLWNLASTFFPTLTNTGSPLTLVVSGRSRFMRGVDSRLQHDYFVVGGTAAWSSGTAYTFGQGVVSSGLYYVCSAAVGPTATPPASDPAHWARAATPDFASAGAIPGFTQQQYNLGASAFGGLFFTDYINDAISGPYTIAATTPSLTTYGGWVTNAASLSWASGVAPGGVNPGQLIAEDSHLGRWQGNVYLRQTRYVLAI